ncbi:MAG: hypothetical protein MI757_01345 [Pirellulales bacterium]|nr:hypothetical protein [Pirellulales bacterium]
MLCLLLLLASGCDRFGDDVYQQSKKIDAKLPQEPIDWLETPTSLDHLGSAEGVEPGGVLMRGITIETDDGKLELKNAVVTRGPTGRAWRDPETGRLVWRAWTCLDPVCTANRERSDSHVFIHEIPGARIVSEGYIVTDNPADSFLPVCPLCNKSNMVREYVHPDVAARRQELDAELRLARSARKAGQDLPDSVRTPMEIMRERALLPRLYLAPRD